MHIRFRTPVELGVPAADVAAALARPELWDRLFPQGHRLGAHWLAGSELYTLRYSSAGPRHEWQARSAAAGIQLALVVTLRDARITTLAAVEVVLEYPFSLARLLGRAALRARIAKIVHAAAGALARLLAPAPAADLAARYPRTVAEFYAMGATEHLERIARLDAAWAAIRQGTPAPGDKAAYTLAPQVSRPGPPDFDLIYAGGGLGLLHAVVMAQHGYRVLLFDRGEVGCAHREWNISRAELHALVAVGFCGWNELASIVMAEYQTGVVRFHAADRPASELWLPQVLDVALDANALLRLARRKLEAAGGTVLDDRTFRGVTVSESGPLAVRVSLAGPNGAPETYRARLLLDGMGSASPLALRRFNGQPFAGVCPTVGTVAAGFAHGSAANQHNPRVGDILISIADAQRGQQYMWEGFPGRGDDLTVYLFYYDTLIKNRKPRTKNPSVVSDGSQFSVLGSAPPSLMQLFEDYFALLPDYKRPGPGFRHIKPVYGYIPARHSVRRQEAPLLRGVLPIGDSAAQQSPLTFCGFGSHVRNLARTTGLLHLALRAGLLEPAHLHAISAYQVNVSLNWVFSRFMQPWAAPEDVNRLQNVFLRVLNDLGTEPARRFFRDQMIWSDYHRMILGMFWRYPRIAPIAWRVLGPAGVRQWVMGYLAFSRAAALARLARAIGPPARAALIGGLGRVAPAAGLRARAHLAEWQAMSWI